MRGDISMETLLARGEVRGRIERIRSAKESTGWRVQPVRSRDRSMSNSEHLCEAVCVIEKVYFVVGLREWGSGYLPSNFSCRHSSQLISNEAGSGAKRE